MEVKKENANEIGPPSISLISSIEIGIIPPSLQPFGVCE